MEDSLFESDEPITLETLASKIKEIKSDADKRILDLQKQVETIRQHVKDLDAKTSKRLIRITKLIDDSFDNFQQIMIIFGDVMTKMNECERRGMTTSDSIARNKRNLQDLSRYVKAADKSLNDVIAEVNKLERSHLDFKMLGKIAIGLVLFGVAIGKMCTGGNVDSLIQFLTKLFGLG